MCHQHHHYHYHTSQNRQATKQPINFSHQPTNHLIIRFPHANLSAITLLPIQLQSLPPHLLLIKRYKRKAPTPPSLSSNNADIANFPPTFHSALKKLLQILLLHIPIQIAHVQFKHPRKVRALLPLQILGDPLQIRFRQGQQLVRLRGNVEETIAGLIPAVVAHGALDAAAFAVGAEIGGAYGKEGFAFAAGDVGGGEGEGGGVVGGGGSGVIGGESVGKVAGGDVDEVAAVEVLFRVEDCVAAVGIIGVGSAAGGAGGLIGQTDGNLCSLIWRDGVFSGERRERSGEGAAAGEEVQAGAEEGCVTCLHGGW
mmetsp:Transcript_9448/g.19861  ORF Transcript_9448/g.19861 Transcript_9448/m.19861 type:complete len:312 (+) Transcript_9448:457-1392(+)